MATAQAYDEFEDPGLSFSDEELTQWSIQGWVIEHISDLLFKLAVLNRYSTIPNMQKQTTAMEAAKMVFSSATFYCLKALLPGLERASAFELPDPKSEEGRRLTAVAVNVDLPKFIDEWVGSAEAARRYFVTIGRRANVAQGWGKGQRSISNQVANAITQEINKAQKIQLLCISTTKEDRQSRSKKAKAEATSES